MKGATTIQERLWELRKDKGLNLEELSKLTGISKSALGNYEKEDYKEINHGNLITLADFYGVSIDYLLCRTENREQINTPLTELHLNDEMVALLKSGRINNRLLCELATHKDFIKFLADIEIYVDGIATMQIQNLNALVDTVRHEIIERYRPGEDDPHLKVLQAAQISDDEYFSHMVLDDLNLIIRGILESHDSAHIASSLDPGTQTVPCIHLTIRDQRLCRPSGNSPGKNLLSASRIDSHMVGNTVFHHRVFQDIRNNSTGCTGSP